MQKLIQNLDEIWYQQPALTSPCIDITDPSCLSIKGSLGGVANAGFNYSVFFLDLIVSS